MSVLDVLDGRPQATAQGVSSGKAYGHQLVFTSFCDRGPPHSPQLHWAGFWRVLFAGQTAPSRGGVVTSCRELTPTGHHG